MHITTNHRANKAASKQPNRIIDTGLQKAYLDYAMSVVVGRPKNRMDGVVAKVGNANRRRTADHANSIAEAGGTDVSGGGQSSGGAGGDGNSDGGDGDGDGPGRRKPSNVHPRRSSVRSRRTKQTPSSVNPDPDLPHRRGLKALVLITLILVCAALILGLNKHECLAFEVLSMAGGLPFLARCLIKPK
jgi:hypothetical protein